MNKIIHPLGLKVYFKIKNQKNYSFQSNKVIFVFLRDKIMEAEKRERPLILVTNDDGVHAGGIKSLMETAAEFGDVLVVAPSTGQSGMSHAITVKEPIRAEKIVEESGIRVYSCTGTPVDCVKLAISQIIAGKPDLVLSGVNHGANSAASVIYSGTMAAAIEGCINQVPSIGFSLADYSPYADFSVAKVFIHKIIENVVKNGLPEEICLNVNIPAVEEKLVKGVKVVRQNKGFWKEEFDKRTDPMNRQYYWLTGEYKNCEPDASDTDEWALKNNYVAVVPVHIDMTGYAAIKALKKQFNGLDHA